MSDKNVVVKTLIDSTPEEIWNLLTNNEEMKHWYFPLEEFKAEKGFKFTFYGGTETRQYLHLCEVTEVAECSRLSYTWQYDGIPGKTIVTFTLEPADDKTLVEISHSGIESFGTGNPDLAPENFAAGWDYILNESLKNHAENTNIELTVEINAPVNILWRVFTDRELSRVWVNEFMTGSYIECDWHIGSIMSWKDTDGAVRASALVAEAQIEAVIRLAVYDNPEPQPDEQPGRYSELYVFEKYGEGSRLSTRSGPVPRKKHTEYFEVWERSFQRIKEKCEAIHP